MRRRIRSLEIVTDLQSLVELGLNVASSADERLTFMLEMFRASALAGQFDHLPAFVDPQRLAVDVGANAGQYALKLAALCPRVLVIEPQAEFAWLQRALPANCVFFPGAAGESEGMARLSVPLRHGRAQTGRATLTTLTGPVVQEQVQVRPLDDLLEQYCPGEAVGFIKVDAEGWSTAVLRGAARTMRHWRPNLQVEIWPEDWAGTTALLEEMGYRGLFGYDGRLYDIGCFDPAVHAAPRNAWQPDDPAAFDPTRYVGDFFFIPQDGAGQDRIDV